MFASRVWRVIGNQWKSCFQPSLIINFNEAESATEVVAKPLWMAKINCDVLPGKTPTNGMWMMKHSESIYKTNVFMKPRLFDSISTLLRTLDLPEPLHPLVTLVDRIELTGSKDKLLDHFLFNFYIISYKLIRQAK